MPVYHNHTAPCNYPQPKQMKIYLGDCRDQYLVEQIFGSVSEFARICEMNEDLFEYDDVFVYGNIAVAYDADTDIHNFYQFSE